MNNKILVSFASRRFENAQKNLVESAKTHGITGYVSYTEDNIPVEFITKNLEIWKNPRGFGYWCWKPYIILKTLMELDDGDMVIYVDSCNLVVSDLSIIFDECNKSEIVLFDNRDGNYSGDSWKNLRWTKRDCFRLMNCDTSKYWNGDQINASYQVYKKTDKSIKFLNEYINFCENKNIISDDPNITFENFDEFEDHRHDQSIASLLAIKYDISLMIDPSEWGNSNINRTYPQLFWHCRGRL